MLSLVLCLLALDGSHQQFLEHDAYYKTTIMQDGVAPLKATATFKFHPTPGPRTLVEGTCLVDDPSVEGADITGEFLRQDKVWANFKFRFQFPPPREGPQAAEFSAEVFPSTYEVRLRILSGDGKKGLLLTEKMEVPALGGETEEMKVAAPAEFVLQGVNPQIPASGLLRVSVPPAEGVGKVGFFLDGFSIGVKNHPPFSLEVDLGSVPLPHTLLAVGMDDGGREKARDSLLLNQGMDSFVARIVEPSGAHQPGASVPFRAQVVVPQNHTVMRLSVYQGDNLLAEASGGRLFSISNEGIGASYESIGRELRSQYHLVYVSTHTGPDFRKVRVQVKGGHHARTIAGYFP